MEDNSYRYQTYHERKSAEWLAIIQECKSSGMTVKDWCYSNGIREKNYWRWHKTLKDECLLELNSPKPLSQAKSCQQPTFYEVPASCATSSGNKIVASIKIGTYSVDIHSDDPAYLIKLLRGLSSC